MDKNLIARASVTIDAPRDEVWDALVNPDAIKQYMFGTDVVTDWREGSPIVVSLSQDNNATEEAREHSEKNWGMMLDALKKFVEE